MGKKYKKNYLKSVIARVDFAAPVEKIGKSVPHGLREKILPSFPIPQSAKSISKELRVSAKKTEEIRTETTQWHFYGKKREKSLCIAPEFFFVEYTEYDSFEVLKGDFLRAVHAVYDAFPDVQAKRFGLRYQNEISLDEGKPMEWGDYLESNLLSALSIPKEQQFISRAFHNLFLTFEDMMMGFRYGMHNPDFPATIRKKVFILDYDAYYDAPQYKEDIERNLETFHEKIENLFETNIKDGLREKMGVV